MITSHDTQDFVPFGRQYIRQHPGPFVLQRKSTGTNQDDGLPIIKSFKEISLQSNSKKENWIFKKHHKNDETHDEELYFQGQTAVWSRGGPNKVTTVVKTFTMDTNILQVMWCSFPFPNAKKETKSLNQDAINAHVRQEGICIVESKTLTFFMEEGEEFTTALPMQVSRAWSIKDGLLLEKQINSNDSDSPKKIGSNHSVVFSIMNPHNEVAPLMIKTSSSNSVKYNYFTDSNINITFTCCEPSIAFTYDCKQGVHMVWKIRNVRKEEVNELSQQSDSNDSNSSFAQRSMLSTSAFGMTGLNLSSSNLNSPINNVTNRAMSPGVIQRLCSNVTPRSHSPGLSTSFNGGNSKNPTPVSQNQLNGMIMRTPRSALNYSVYENENYFEKTPSLVPEICLELVWTEPSSLIRSESLGKASKAFLTQDFCGQQFLCFMVPYKQHLRCLKFEESNDMTQLVFGSLNFLHAKDATPIESLNMLLVLETSGVIILYSGMTKISQVHIPVLPLGSGSISLLKSTTPFDSPVRGEVITSSRPPSAMDIRFEDEMTHISPVSSNLEDSSGQLEGSLAGLATPGSSYIQYLRDNVGKRFNVELFNGAYCRTELPDITNSSGINLCLKALKHLLPSDFALQFLGRWYTTRNSPGSTGSISEWELFTKCLLSSMGYDTAKLALLKEEERDGSSSPVMMSKKAKSSDDGSDKDFEMALQSEHHKLSFPHSHKFGLSDAGLSHSVPSFSQPCAINNSSFLFPFCPAIMLALHMVYEELKLDVMLHDDLKLLAPLVHQLAGDLQCFEYVDYYKRDFPHLFELLDDLSQITENDLKKMNYPQVFPTRVASVYEWAMGCLKSPLRATQVPYIPLVCERVRKVVSLYSVLINEEVPTEVAMEKYLKRIAPAGHRAPTAESFSSSLGKVLKFGPSYQPHEKLVLAMSDLGITLMEIDRLPMGISIPLREACLASRSDPPSGWPKEAYQLIGRQDLVELASLQITLKAPRIPEALPQGNKVTVKVAEVEKAEINGMESLDKEALKLRFPKDLRIQEVNRLLQSARPVPIVIKQRPEVSDHDFIEEQEKNLLAICIRTMALPIGRGMFTLQTCQPSVTEALPIPKLCLTGQTPPRNTTVDLSRIEVPPNMSVWPEFHNGVAAGLRVENSTQVDSAWIVFNQPKEVNNEFAGFLMALGLNGHLHKIDSFNAYKYMAEGSEIMSVGMLLGMAAAKRGSMDVQITKALSIHISALHPAGSTKLNILHNVRVSAIMGIGLLYQGTGQLDKAEVMLAEIGRQPGPEMENCVDRESYALSAGLSLGLIMFGKGNRTIGLSDLRMADVLYHFMVGGHTQTVFSNTVTNNQTQTPSYLIDEGDSVNCHVTSPGATLALGMIFFNTKNKSVSNWLRAPDTPFMLDEVRPDFLCLRAISLGLVNWDHILPSSSWILTNVPDIVKNYAFLQSEPEGEAHIDLSSMSQAHCYITAGACLVMAFKFASSANKEAFKTLMDSLRSTMMLLGDPSLLDQTSRSTVENCLSIKLLAIAIVMAGTGNLEILKLCRVLHRRVGIQYHTTNYGHHMCYSMATGLLFLGGGKLALKTTQDAVGAMLCAFFPQFPISSTDNKFHLQAFRHLYVLACEPRLIIPRDIDTGKLCHVPVRIKFKATDSYDAESFDVGAPYILPELDKIEEVQILGDRYWPILFRDGSNLDVLKLLLQQGGVLNIKQRAGHLPYMDDPKGYRSIFVKSLTADNSNHFTCKPEVIRRFTSDVGVMVLAKYFVRVEEKEEFGLTQEFSSIIYQCVTQEKPEAICPQITLRHILEEVSESTNTLDLQQLKLAWRYYRIRQQLNPSIAEKDRILPNEFLTNLRMKLDRLLDNWHIENPDCVLKYLKGEVERHKPSDLANYLVWFSLPSSTQILEPGFTKCPSVPVLSRQFPQLCMSGALRLHRILKTANL